MFLCNIFLHVDIESAGTKFLLLFVCKNVLQFWLCYIRKMVQFHVLDLVSCLTVHFTLPELGL